MKIPTLHITLIETEVRRDGKTETRWAATCDNYQLVSQGLGPEHVLRTFADTLRRVIALESDKGHTSLEHLRRD